LYLPTSDFHFSASAERAPYSVHFFSALTSQRDASLFAPFASRSRRAGIIAPPLLIDDEYLRGWEKWPEVARRLSLLYPLPIILRSLLKSVEAGRPRCRNIWYHLAQLY
jgi:hypothetical protein